MQTCDGAVTAQTLARRTSSELSDEQRQFANVFGHLLVEKWKRALDGQRANAQQQHKEDESS